MWEDLPLPLFSFRLPAYRYLPRVLCVFAQSWIPAALRNNKQASISYGFELLLWRFEMQLDS